MTDTSGALTPEQIAELKRRRAERSGVAMPTAEPSPQFQYERNMALETEAPDDAAYDLKKSTELGIPREAIAGAREEYRAEDMLRQMEMMRKEAPRTTEWMQQPDNYAVARDDVPTLGALERAFITYLDVTQTGKAQKALATFGPAMEASMAGVALSSLEAPGLTPVDAAIMANLDKVRGLDEAGAAVDRVVGAVRTPDVKMPSIRNPFAKAKVRVPDAIDPKRIRDRASANALEAALSANARLEAARPKGVTPESQAILSGIGSATEMAPALAAGLLTRNATLPTAIMGRQVYGQSYIRGREEGLSPGGASLYAGAQSGIERATERLGLEILFGRDFVGRSIGKRLLASLTVEQVQEQFATLGQDFVDWQVLNQEKTFDQFLEERGPAAYQTAIATLVASGPTNAAVLGIEKALMEMGRLEADSRPSEGQRRFSEILDKVSASKLAKRSPEKMTEYVGKLTDGTEVETMMVDLDGVVEALEQAGVDPVETLEALGVDGYQAMQNWERFGEIEVKTSTLVTSPAMTAHRAAIEPHVKAKQDAATPAQKEALRADFEAALKDGAAQIQGAIDAGKTTAEKVTQVRESLKARILGAGMDTQGPQLEAKLDALTALLTTLPQRTGQDVLDFYAQRAPKIQGVMEGEVMEDDGALQQQLETLVLEGAPELLLTEEYRGEAEQWLRAKAKGLDLTEEGRMARAQEQGFDTGKVYYHGTTQNFDQFSRVAGAQRNNSKGRINPRDDSLLGVHVGTQEQAQAILDNDGATEGAQVLPVLVRAKKSIRLEDTGRWTPEGMAIQLGKRGIMVLPTGVQRDGKQMYLMQDIRDELKRLGFDSIIYANKFEGPKGQDSLIILDESNIRSVHAVFDPDQRSSPDLLAQARQAGYQGRDRGEAESWVRAVEKGLDMGTEARMARAEAAGFKGGYFHGARVYDALLKDGTQLGNIEAFDRETSAKFRKRSMDTLGVWLSDNPGERGAGMYAGNVVEGESDGRPIIYPLMVRANNTFETTWDEVKKKAAELNDDPEGKMPSSMEPYREWLKDKGYDSVSFASDNPEFAGQKVTVILDENNIRSVHAAFDPDQSDSADLLGQLIGPKAKSADKAILNHAKKMAKERVKVGKGLLAKTKPKYTRQQIWDETAKMGQPWYQDQNGDWISEIEDGSIVVKDGKGPLSEVIEFPSIYAEYPELKKMRADARDKAAVKRESGKEEPGGVGGWYSKSPFLFGVHVRIISRGNQREYTATHEIQHAVDDIEGREMGRKRPYYSKDTERRAFNTMYRRLMTMEERIATPPWVTEAEAVNWWAGQRDMNAPRAKFTPPGTPDPGPNIEPPEITMPKSRADENVSGRQQSRDLAMPGEILRGTDYRDGGTRADTKVFAPPTALLGRTFLTVREMIRSAAKNERIAEIVGSVSSADVLAEVRPDVEKVFAEYEVVKADPYYAEKIENGEYTEFDIWNVAAEQHSGNVLFEGMGANEIAEVIHSAIEAGRSMDAIVEEFQTQIRQSRRWMNDAVEGLTRRSGKRSVPRTKAEEAKEVKRVEAGLADKLLDMDKPLEGQPANVRQFFEDMIAEQQSREDLIAGGYDFTQPGYFDGMTAGALMRELADAQSAESGIRDPMIAMIQRLRAAGIVGAKYVPGGIKEDGAPPSQSIVIFDERAPVLLTDQSGNLMQERRGQYAPRTDVITLFEQADVTTLMHEAAHWYLETLYSMSVEPDAHPFVVEQYEAIRKWGKVGPDFRMYDDMGRLTPEAIELHESFAETFEVYLQTGKAPSASLRSAFQAFKKWITQLWKRMYGGGQPERANLNPEIVAVMDRMLAVDEEIDAQVEGIIRSAEQQADELLKRGIITKRQRDTAIMNLETARESAKEDLMARLMDAKMREDEAWWNTERARARRDVLREFDRSPVGRALSWLGYGQWKGDVPAGETEAVDGGEVEFFQEGYHGTQREIIGVLQPSPDGLLGPGINLAKQPGKAKAYAGENGQVYIVDFDETRLATYAQWKAARSQAGRELGAGRTRAANQLAVDRLTAEGFIGVDAGDTVTIWSSENIAQREETLGQTLPRDLIRGAAGRDIGTAPALPSKAEMVAALDVQVGFAEALLADNQNTDLADVTLRLRRTMEQADNLPRNEFLGAWYANLEALARVTDGISPPFAASVRDALASPLGQRVKAVLDDRGVRILQADQVGNPPVLLIRARMFEGDTLGQSVVRPAEKADTTVAGGLTEKSFIRTRDLEGATIFPMFADLTDAGSTFAALDGLPIAPTPYLGGPNFPWLKSYRDAGIVWAFNAPGVISKVRNKVRALKEQARAEGRSDRVVITMLAMKDDAHTSNEMVVSALLRTLDAVVAAGRFPQEQLAQAKELIVSKAGKKDEGYSELATFPGFGDAQALHDWIRTATFTGRKALASEMRSAAFQQMPGMFPVERIVREAIDPDYRATQQGDALLAFEIDPDAEDLIIDFENKDQAGNVPRHPAYRYGMRGTLVGSFSTHIPMEVLYADLLPAVVGRAAPGSNPKFLMERLKTSDAQVVTEDIVREAEVIEGLHDYRIAQAHTAGIAGQWRSSDVAANRGGVNPVEFERALLENQAAATLTKYTRTDVTKGKKDGSLRVFQLGGARVQDGGLNVWMAVKAGYDYRNEYPGEVTDALVEQGILTDNEVALVGVASNELGVSGMATFQVLKGIEEGVTVLDAFKVTSPSKPDGLLPTIYATLGFEEVGQIPFDPQYYDAQQLADLKAIWTRQGWNEADGYPAVAIMKWRGDDAVRPEATRRFILESQEGLGIGSTPDVAAIEASTESVRDSDGQSDQGDGLPGQGDGRADPRRFADRARSVSGTVRSYVENILAADARAIKALKLPQELIDRIRAEYGPVLEQTPDDTLGQPVAPIFYSALGRFVSRSGTARAPAAQWKGMIQNAPGIKAEEVEWTGVMEWLDLQQGAVTREALAAFVEANGVRVEEVVRGGGTTNDELQRQLLPLIEERDRVRREFDALVSGEGIVNLRDMSPEEQDNVEELSARLSILTNDIDRLQRSVRNDDTKWSSWTLSGGENYREMLLTLPVKPTGNMVSPNGAVFTAEELANPVVARTAGRVGLVPEDAGFRSSHWSEPNVLAHVRFKERTGPNGERVLALEEIQSDWHQAGRERGYKTNDRSDQRREQLLREKDVIANEIDYLERDAQFDEDMFDEDGNRTAKYDENRARYAELRRRQQLVLQEIVEIQNAVPNAPFKNNAWTELVLKRMIRYAAENGFDAVAWIPGNIQNGRVVKTDDNRGDFYDKIVPNAANKIGKKFGARVERIKLPKTLYPFVVRDGDGIAQGTYSSRREAEIALENILAGNIEDTDVSSDATGPFVVGWTNNDVDFHSLPITPELAAAAMTEGFPLFQPGDPKGWGETAPPPDLPPMRLDLARTEEIYGKAAVDALPKAIKDRYRDQTSVDTMLAAARGAAKTLKRKPPKSLFQFIRARKSRSVEGKSVPQKQWGIKGATDELKAMDRADLINEASGIDIDYMRELAEGAGYLPEGSTVNDLLNAIDREARGELVYSEQDANEVLEIQSAQQWADWLSENGVDIFEADQRKLKAAIAKVTRTTNADLKSPDEAAELLGFENGEQLLKALAEAGSREKYIDAETDRRMREEFGDPFASGEFAEAARQAAEAEVKFRAAEIEIEALARALGETAASKLAKEMAMDALSVMTVKELAGWERFLEIERREMRNAMKAVQAGDISKALTHKRRQLVNGHLAKAAREKSEALEKTRKDLLTYFTSKGRRDKISRDYLDKIEALLETYELRVSKQTPGVQRKAMSAKEYVDQMVADGREAEIAPEAMLLAAQADKKVWRGLTVDEVEYLAGTVKNLAHLGRTKNSLMKAQDKRRFDAVVAELVDTLVAAPTAKDRRQSFTPTQLEKLGKGLREFDARLTRLEFEFQKLDGRENGPLWNALFRPFAEAADAETREMRGAADRMRGLYEAFTASERQQLFNRRVSTPELDVPGKDMTIMDVVTIGLNWGNEGNRKALIDGYGWDPAAVEAVLNRVLTDKHWDFITGVWDLIGSYRDEAFALEKAITGVAPKAVEGIEFTLASGRTIKGKYYPLKYDGAQPRADSVVVSRLDEKQALSDLGKTFSKPMTKTGHLIERVGSGGKPVKLQIGVMHEHVQNVIHDIAYRRAVIDAHRIIRDPRFANAYMAAAGREQYDQLLPWLAAIATERNGDPGGIVTKLMQGLRRNMTIVAMGYKISTAVQQVTGPVQGMAMIGPVYTAQGFVRALAGGPASFWSAWKWVAAKSEFMRDRPQGYDRDTRMVTNRMQERTPLGAMQRNSMILTNIVDVASSTIVWIGAYQRAMDGNVQGIAKGAEDDAVAWADSVVRQTQAAGRIQDLPQIMRGTETEKLVTMMYSYFSGLYNLTKKQATLARYGQMNQAAFTANMILLFVVTPLMAATLAGRMFDDEDDEEELLAKAGKEILSNATGTIPIFRDVAGATINPQFGYQMSPVGSGIDRLTKAAARAAEGDSLESDAAVRELVGAMGLLFGLPSGQLIITGDYVYDLAMGEEDPMADPADAANEALLRNRR